MIVLLLSNLFWKLKAETKKLYLAVYTNYSGGSNTEHLFGFQMATILSKNGSHFVRFSKGPDHSKFEQKMEVSFYDKYISRLHYLPLEDFTLL